MIQTTCPGTPGNGLKQISHKASINLQITACNTPAPQESLRKDWKEARSLQREKARKARLVPESLIRTLALSHPYSKLTDGPSMPKLTTPPLLASIAVLACNKCNQDVRLQRVQTVLGKCLSRICWIQPRSQQGTLIRDRGSWGNTIHSQFYLTVSAMLLPFFFSALR